MYEIEVIKAGKYLPYTVVAICNADYMQSFANWGELFAFVNTLIKAGEEAWGASDESETKTQLP